MDGAFDVDLTGLLRVFGGHLYSEPAVFVRELAQNGIDAITLRRREEPDHAGRVTVRADPDALVVTVDDDGIGLDEAGLIEHLSRIGGSSKRGDACWDSGLIGQFGIGLLSSFLVADRIVVQTRTSGGAPLRWDARVDGRYTVSEGSRPGPGTTVTVHVRGEHRVFARPDHVASLLRRYVPHVSVPILVEVDDGSMESIATVPRWMGTDDEALSAWIYERTASKALATRAFDHDAGRGSLWIVEARTDLSPARCDLYHHGVLVQERATDLLPQWAGFAHAVLDAPGLSPTASREGFVHDGAWDALREALRRELVGWLRELATGDPARFTELLRSHHSHLLAACIEDVDLMESFGSNIPFETNVGVLSLSELAERGLTLLRFVTSSQGFLQVGPVAAAASQIVIDASHVHEARFLRAWARHRPEREVVELDIHSLADLVEPASEHEPRFAFVLRAARAALDSLAIEPRLARFGPAEVPALLVADPSSISERAHRIREEGSPLQRALLAGLDVARNRPRSPLLLNVDNPLVSALPELAEPELAGRVVRMLYVQSAITVRRTLSVGESRQLSEDLLGLLRATNAPSGTRH